MAPAGTAGPAAAATAAGTGGGSSGGGGFGFSFPTTPPSAVDAAVHEERAERVFSTWASNHSRSGLDAAEDEEGTLRGTEKDNRCISACRVHRTYLIAMLDVMGPPA